MESIAGLLQGEHLPYGVSLYDRWLFLGREFPKSAAYAKLELCTDRHVPALFPFRYFRTAFKISRRLWTFGRPCALGLECEARRRYIRRQRDRLDKLFSYILERLS